VPYGVDLAAAWSWRLLVIIGAAGVLLWMVGHVTLVLVPVFAALFVAALAAPVVAVMAHVLPRGLSTLLVVVTLLGAVVLMLVFATQQVVQGANDLADQVVTALDQIRTWLQDGPLHATDKQIDDSIKSMQDLVLSSNKQLAGRVQEVGTAISHVVAAFFIALFSTYFFLADGDRIWLWVVRLFPRAARGRADASGRVAWLSLTQYVRATVLVAATDAIGIMIVAAVLKVPFVMAIGVLVFLGSFVPLVGSTVSGSVAVLVALVDQGPFVALLMTAGVIGVQQLEAHVLQPFLLGRMVAVHPLGVILAVACGIVVAGILGALLAVPLVACANAVVTYLAAEPPPPSVTAGSLVSTEDEVAEDPGR
jgi:predicted PurR-regulated permease PerM